jgi:hypothetical protein
MRDRIIAIGALAIVALASAPRPARAERLVLSPWLFDPSLVVDPLAPHAAPTPQACFDDTDIVGYRACPHYAAWGDNLHEPYFVVESGLNYRHFADLVDPPTTERTVGGGEPTTTARRHDTALTIDERFVRRLDPALYTALDFEFGNLMMGTAPRDLEADALASIGVRANLGPVMLAGELAGGGRFYTYAGQDTMHGAGVVEARARGAVWLGPWVSVGAMVGTSLITSGEWVAGGFIEFHSRTYAGQR